MAGFEPACRQVSHPPPPDIKNLSRSMEREPGSEHLFLGKYEVDADGYLNFGDISSGELGMQSQYGGRYVSGLDRPKLSEGLRFLGNPHDYHDLRIHKEDAEEFIRRVREHRRDI